MLTPFSISQGVTGQSAVWCRVKKSRALNSCQQHALASNQSTNANNTGRGTINRSVVAPLQPRTSERRAPERHGRAAGLVLLRSERCGPVSQIYWETETGHADSRCFFFIIIIIIEGFGSLLQNKPRSDLDCLEWFHTGGFRTRANAVRGPLHGCLLALAAEFWRDEDRKSVV